MDIHILGTAAAEGWPAIFCACDTCRRARAVGGKNRRSRASIMIGDRHKIDLPPDVFYHEAVLGADFSRLQHLFISHTHGDHLDMTEMHYFKPPFGHNNSPKLTVYGNGEAAGKLRPFVEAVFPDGRVEVVHLKAFEPVKADDLTFTPITAKHMKNEECFNYIVSDGNRSFLYTCDTGLYDAPTWEYLESVKLDMLISECTNGALHQSDTHTSFKDVLEMAGRLRESGTLGVGSRVILTHFSHNIGILHEEFEEIASPHGIEIAYDGMRLSI